MPRKPKASKTSITVVVDSKPIVVTLHPPTGVRKSWFAYWNGLLTSKSTGVSQLDAAVVIAEQMVRSGGRRPSLTDSQMTDDEFIAIQRRHHGKQQEPDALRRAQKSLGVCLDAIEAFRRISGIRRIVDATPDDCERFQLEALALPRNWRNPGSKKSPAEVTTIRPNTILKWSRALQAAFERANRNAGRKCIRGVVPEAKLLSSNPWQQFEWIGGTRPQKRQFEFAELLSILDYFESVYPGFEVPSAFAKLSLWTCARRSEISSLTWSDLRDVDGEKHFEIIGKWGVRKWARIPNGLYTDLLDLKTDQPHVFSSYPDGLRTHFFRSGHPKYADKVGAEFNPSALGDWFQRRMADWSAQHDGPRASPHVFRKTALQIARSGEDLNRELALDAAVNTSVLMKHYIADRDEELRAASNRMFRRLVAALPADVAERFGHSQTDESSGLREQIRRAVELEDWPSVHSLSARLQQ